MSSVEVPILCGMGRHGPDNDVFAMAKDHRRT
jgi:hypothetical protein